LEINKDGGKEGNTTFGIVVIDEAHHVVANVALSEQLQKLKDCKSRFIFLGDASQTSATNHLTVEGVRKCLELSKTHLVAIARLYEVIRSTNCIIAGAGSFQLVKGSKAETKTHTSSVGLPLYARIFQQEDLWDIKETAHERYECYASRVVEVLNTVKEDLQGKNLDDHVLIICLDMEFVKKLHEPLRKELNKSIN